MQLDEAISVTSDLTSLLANGVGEDVLGSIIGAVRSTMDNPKVDVASAAVPKAAQVVADLKALAMQ